MYSRSRTVAMAQSVEEGAAFAGRPLSLPASFLAGGAGCSQAWHGSASACLVCDGRISATGRAPTARGCGLCHRRREFSRRWRGSRLGRVQCRPQWRAPWCWCSALFLTLWEVVTAKFGLLPLPFFPSPQAIIEVYTDDLPRLLDSSSRSVAAARRLCHRRRRRFHHRRRDRLVAQRRLLGASGPAPIGPCRLPPGCRSRSSSSRRASARACSSSRWRPDFRSRC